MTPTLTQVRTALQDLAAKKGRPDYELCTANAVKRALENGTEHHLIAELPFFEVLPLIAVPVVVEEAVVVKPKRPKHRASKARVAKKREYPTTAQIAELTTWLNTYKGSHAALARMAGCSGSILSHIKLGKRNCTLEMYKKLTKARKKLEGVAA